MNIDKQNVNEYSFTEHLANYLMNVETLQFWTTFPLTPIPIWGIYRSEGFTGTGCVIPARLDVWGVGRFGCFFRRRLSGPFLTKYTTCWCFLTIVFGMCAYVVLCCGSDWELPCDVFRETCVVV